MSKAKLLILPSPSFKPQENHAPSVASPISFEDSSFLPVIQVRNLDSHPWFLSYFQLRNIQSTRKFYWFCFRIYPKYTLPHPFHFGLSHHQLSPGSRQPPWMVSLVLPLFPTVYSQHGLQRDQFKIWVLSLVLSWLSCSKLQWFSTSHGVRVKIFTAIWPPSPPSFHLLLLCIPLSRHNSSTGLLAIFGQTVFPLPRALFSQICNVKTLPPSRLCSHLTFSMGLILTPLFKIATCPPSYHPFPLPCCTFSFTIL